MDQQQTQLALASLQTQFGNTDPNFVRQHIGFILTICADSGEWDEDVAKLYVDGVKEDLQKAQKLSKWDP